MVIRDVGMLLVGLGGITYQQVTGNINVELLAVYTALLGIPGAAALWSLGPKGRPPTIGSSLPPPQEPSHSDSS